MPESYTPAEEEFVFVVRDGVIQYPGKVKSVDPSTQTAPHPARR